MMKPKSSAQEKLKPNVAFVGAKRGKEPILFISNGDLTIRLPKDQSKPFHHPDAARIVRLLPELYKPVQT